MAEPWIANANVARNRAAQISSKQDCPKYRRARNQIESDTTQQKNADAGRELNGISQFPESFYCWRGNGLINLKPASTSRKNTTKPLMIRPAHSVLVEVEVFSAEKLVWIAVACIPFLLSIKTLSHWLIMARMLP